MTRDELVEALTLERFTRHVRTAVWEPPKAPDEPQDLDEIRQAMHRKVLDREVA